jgi:hypothetical protein
VGEGGEKALLIYNIHNLQLLFELVFVSRPRGLATYAITAVIRLFIDKTKPFIFCYNSNRFSFFAYVFVFDKDKAAAYVLPQFDFI